MHQLLHRYIQLQSSDVDHVQSYISGILCSHQLRPHNKDKVNTHLYYRSGNHLGWGRLSYGQTVDIKPQPLSDFYLLQIPIKGKEIIWLTDKNFSYDYQTASLICPQQLFTMQHNEDTDKLFIRICKKSLLSFFQTHYQRPLEGELVFTPTLSLQHGPGSSLWQLLQWQFYEVSEGTWFNYPAVQKRLEETFLACLLDVWQHNQHLPTARQLTPHSIKKAQDYIHQHLAQPLSVGRISQHVGISTRSLYAGFKEFLGISPMQYVKQERLSTVHKLLQEADPQQHTVTELALLVGFSHLGQFAVDYQSVYGVRPSRTLQKNS